MSKMNTIEITQCLKSVSGFKGVFASDLVPKIKTGCFVVNTVPSSESGQHWICFTVQNGKMYACDPYGRDPFTYPHLHHFLNNYSYNIKRIQSTFSSVCGQYCVYFLYQYALGKTHSEILSAFGENLEENDIYVANWLNEKFDLSLPVIDLEFSLSQIALPEDG